MSARNAERPPSAESCPISRLWIIDPLNQGPFEGSMLWIHEYKSFLLSLAGKQKIGSRFFEPYGYSRLECQSDDRQERDSNRIEEGGSTNWMNEKRA